MSSAAAAAAAAEAAAAACGLSWSPSHLPGKRRLGRFSPSRSGAGSPKGLRAGEARVAAAAAAKAAAAAAAATREPQGPTGVGDVCLVVAETDVVHAAAVQAVHHPAGVVQLREEGRGDKVAGEQDDGVGGGLLADAGREAREVVQLIHVVHENNP